MTMIRRCIATFQPEAWQNDNAIPVDAPGDCTWDVTDFVRRSCREDRSLRPSVISALNGGFADCDWLRDDPHAPVWMQTWDGPFEIDLEIEKRSLEQVIADRAAAANEHGLTPEQMAERHGGPWGEHSEHPVSDWQFEVANDDTRRSYWEWVCANVESDWSEAAHAKAEQPTAPAPGP